MNPAPAEDADMLLRFRQNLILAQVRIMELEDVRDELAPRLEDFGRLLRETQGQLDTKLDEHAHLTRTLADLQQQYAHVQHLQHVAHEELRTAQAALAAAAAREQQLHREAATAEARAGQQAGEIARQAARLGELTATLQSAQAESAARGKRVAELDAERTALKQSRSWRWTAWLRSLEKLAGGRP